MTDIATRDNAAVDPHGPTAGALALRADQQQWTDQQRAGLAQLGVANAPAGDLSVFLHVAQRTGLDPFSRQIYMIERGGKWTIQTGIDGLRVIAARNPAYAGQVGPQWCGDDGVWHDYWPGKTPPVAARVGVVRRDWAEPVWGVAAFAEFTAGNQMWRVKPAHMIAKVAEALALRKAFPHDLAGLVSDDETGRDDRPAATVAHAAPVTAAELTGTPPPQPAAGAAGGRMTNPQQGKLFALLREAEIEDRNVWATQILGRDITSYGQLTVTDAAALIDNLEAALGGDDTPPDVP